MFLKTRHPLLNGCRIFLWPSGRIHSNLVGRDPTPTVTGAPVQSSLKTCPALTLNGSSYATYGAINGYGNTGKDFTIAFRAKNTTTPASSGASVVATARAGFPANHGFIAFLGNTPAANETGWTFSVFAAGTELKICDTDSAASYLNADVPVVVTYNAALRTVTLFVDGRKKATTTNTGQDWDFWGDSSLLYIGATEIGGVPFIGDLGYFIAWDRCLDEGEARAVMLDHDWPFLKDDEIVGLFAIQVHYTTSIGVAEALGVSGAVTYVTTVDASADFSGDMSSVPDPTGDVLYVTTVNVRSVGVGETPEFARYVTSVHVSQVYSPSQPVTYTTQVLVSPHKTERIDGRTDLLDTFRYRR
jgi:hypothetical protein